MRGSIVTLTGPSCSGKTTIMKAILEAYPDKFVKLPGITTRDRRFDELEVSEYTHISMTEFEQQLAAGRFAQHVYFKGVGYATSYDDILEMTRKGRIGITIVEPSGVEQFDSICKDLGLDYQAVYIEEELPILMERWVQRVSDLAGADNQIDTAHFARRMIATTDEVHWKSKMVWDFVCKSDATHWLAESLLGHVAKEPLQTAI